MSTFDNLIKIDKNGKIYLNQWIEWIHPPIPFYGRAKEHAGKHLVIIN